MIHGFTDSNGDRWLVFDVGRWRFGVQWGWPLLWLPRADIGGTDMGWFARAGWLYWGVAVVRRAIGDERGEG